MCEQQEVDGGGVEAERLRVFLVKFASSLEKPAIDEDPLSCAFDHVTGAGYILIGSVK
jgi:hypothetical protein